MLKISTFKDSPFHRYPALKIPYVLASHDSVDRCGESSQLEVMIDLTLMFFNLERENWMPCKHCYACITQLHSFHQDFYNRDLKPPMDQITFYKLIPCWEFEPFHQHLRETQQKTPQRHKLNTILLRDLQPGGPGGNAPSN